MNMYIYIYMKIYCVYIYIYYVYSMDGAVAHGRAAHRAPSGHHRGALGGVYIVYVYVRRP